MKNIGILLGAALLLLVPRPGVCTGWLTPSNCTVDPLVVGNSSGAGITVSGHAYAGFRVVIRDDVNQPMSGVDVRLHAYYASGVKLYASQSSGTTINCADGYIAKNTDANGIVTFTPRFGGHDPYGFNLTAAEDYYLLVQDLPGRSTDMDHDGKTDLSDWVLFSGAYGTNAAEADFNGSGGVVDLADLVIFSSEFGGATYSLCP